MTRSLLTLVSASLMVIAFADTLPAQRLFFGAGVGAGTVPRALYPLCASARRLRGVAVTGRAGVDLSSVQVAATVDHVRRMGVWDAAECIARSGLTVDSAFASTGNSATTLGLGGWVPVNRALGTLQVGAEAGWVLDHSSWFIGPALGAQFRRVRVEITARRHAVSYDEITRDYGVGTVREISRQSRSESSWGAVTRLILLAR